MKILCFSDLHISNRNPKFKFTDGISDLLVKQDEFIEQICEYAVKEEVDDIVFLGDWTDYPNLDPVTLYYSNMMISKLAKTGKQIFLLEGNHCLSFKDNSFSVLDATSKAVNYENVHFINFNVVHKRDDALTYYFFPYNSDKEQLVKDIVETNKKAKKDITNVMFFHFPTMNALYDSGLKSSSGIELRQEYISNFDISLGGDFHKAQKLLGTKNAHYIGAPFCLTYSDVNDDRGFIVYNPDNQKIVRIENKSLIKFHKFGWEQIESQLSKDFSNCIVKLTEEITLEQKKTIEESNLAKTCYRLDYSFLKEEKKKSSEVNTTEAFQSKDDTRYFEDLLNKQENIINKDVLLSLFNKLKSEVDK